MAITKIWKVRNRLKRSLEYIINPNKTNARLDFSAPEKVEVYIFNKDKKEAVYVRAYGCTMRKATEIMLETQRRYSKKK